MKTYDKERDRFLTRVKERRNMDPLDFASIGIEDRLVGSITFMRLSRYGCVSVRLYVH